MDPLSVTAGQGMACANEELAEVFRQTDSEEKVTEAAGDLEATRHPRRYEQLLAEQAWPACGRARDFSGAAGLAVRRSNAHRALPHRRRQSTRERRRRRDEAIAARQAASLAPPHLHAATEADGRATGDHVACHRRRISPAWSILTLWQ
jgi:hypothetical protein